MRQSLALLALLAGVVALYSPSLGNGFLYDDHEVIGVQAPVRSVAEIATLFAEPHFRGLPYYRPVTRVTLLAQKGLHGDDPAAFRLGNALLMATAALLAFALLRSPGLGVAREPALLAAALLAVHPVASSTVYPIASGRESLLPAVLMLACVTAWVRDRRALALASLLAALFAKEQAAVLPGLLVLADVFLVSARPPRREARAWVRRYAPVAVVVALYAAARAAVLGGTSGIRLAVLDEPLGPLLSLGYGLQTAFAPTAALVYEPELFVWPSAPRLALAAAGLAGLALLARRLRAPPLRIALFWAGWFVLAQLPTAHVVRQEAAYAERWTFLALLALPAVAAGSVTAAWSRPAVRLGTRAVAAALIVGTAATSLHRARYFRDDAAFATRWLETQPDSPDANHLLGVVRLRERDLPGALFHLRKAEAAAVRPVDIRVNLAAALAAQGRASDAERTLRAALADAPEHPEAHLNLGAMLAREARLDEAIEHYRRSLATSPRLAGAHAKLGVALVRTGRGDEAEAHLREALRLEPGQREARVALERLLRR